jgi:tetratricopeptide (TPR) repeat protein
MEKPDYTAAEQQLNRARDVLGLVNDPRLHAPERWQWMLSMGRLAMMQKKYDEAEQYYKKALELRQSGDKDAAEMAVTLAELGKLHAERKRFDLARDEAARSLAIYQKNFKKVASPQVRVRPFDASLGSTSLRGQGFLVGRTGGKVIRESC